MVSKINTKNYLVISTYAKDGINTEDFKEILKIIFDNNQGTTFSILVAIYKDNLIYPHEKEYFLVEI